jgi:hypothetical protein
MAPMKSTKSAMFSRTKESSFEADMTQYLSKWLHVIRVFEFSQQMEAVCAEPNPLGISLRACYEIASLSQRQETP